MFLHKHELHIYSDSDWAGDLQTRKSTSGFIIQYCGATISFGSRTQESVATSSCEPELYGMGTATAEALHLQHLLAEARLTSREPTLILHTDSTSAKSLASRVGLRRKSKHIQLRYLYLQELVTNKLLTLAKVHTPGNPADLFTEHLPDKTLQYLRTWAGLQGVTVVSMASPRVCRTSALTSWCRTSGSETPP